MVEVLVARRLALLALAGTACGPPPVVEPPKPPVVEAPHYPLAAATDAERHLFGLINEARAAAKLPVLAWNEQVALVARVSSARIRDVPSEASLRESDYGDLSLVAVTENIARSPTIDDAELAWMSSPREHGNLLSPSASQIGVGVVEAPDHTLCATAIVFDVTPATDTRLVASRITSVLTAEHGPRLDTALESVAREFAAKLASGAKADDVWPEMQSHLSQVDRKYVKFRYSVTKASVLDALPRDRAVEKLLNGQSADDIGVAVAQAPHPEIGNGAIWIVVVYADEMPFQHTERAR